MASDAKTFMVEDAKIIYRNFSGVEGQYNRQGDRNFSVIVDQKVADKLIKDGWNVKYTKPRDEEDEPVPFVPVSVNFNNRPPRVNMLTSVGRTILTEETVDILDWADIAMIDLIVRGYDWDVNGKSGTKGYLQSMFVTIEEDELERKYANYDIEHEEP